MSLTLFDSLTRTRQDFAPMQPGQVRLYACGVTVYDRCHIGHAMQAIVYDVIRHYLEWRGYQVTYVRNYTDVDDKIIERARERGLHPLALSAEMIEACEQDMARLGVRPADHSPRVSGYMPQIIALIERLIQQGQAYAVEGDVYFSIQRFPRYGELSNRKVEDMRAGARVEINEKKKDAVDFALWKAARAGEVSWSSPWGEGRPGWHIECSAMALSLLGETFDIHGGGKDLIFPHHENEIAQSEAATGKKFANYWIHNGLLTVEGRKMSKSFNNFLTIEDALQRWHADAIRHAIVSHHYASSIDFNEKLFHDAYHRLIYFGTLWQKLAELREQYPDLRGETPVNGEWADLREQFIAAMDDDFNSAAALGVLAGAARTFNELLQKSGKQRGRIPFLLWLGETIQDCMAVFGLVPADPGARLDEYRGYLVAARSLDQNWIEGKIAERVALRREKRWQEADAIRLELVEAGVLLMDGLQGTHWQIEP
jgi:cysteinyl-tRNA synthetase